MISKIKDILNKFWWLKALVLIVLSACIALTAEWIYTAGTKHKVTSSGSQCQMLGIDGENLGVERIEYEDGSVKLKYSVSIPEVYVDKFQYKYDVDENKTFEVVVDQKNVYGEWEQDAFYDHCYANLEFSQISIGKVVRCITIYTQDFVDLSDFAINNVVTMNKYRALFWGVFILLALMVICFRKSFSSHFEYAAALIIAAVGSLIILMGSTQFNSWDDHIHFQKTFDFYKPAGDEYKRSEAEWFLFYYPENEVTDPVASREEKAAMVQYLNEADSRVMEESEEYVKSPFTISDTGYFLMATVVRAAKALGLPFYTVVMIGRFTNLFMYALLILLAVRVLPAGKRFLGALAVMPTPVLLASSYSYDACVIGFLALGTALLVREFFTPSEKIRPVNMVLILLCFAIGSAPKAIYIPLILSVFALPDSKFKNKKTKWILGGTALVICILMMLTFLLPTAEGVGGDVRGGDTSVARQLVYVLSHPIAYLKILIHEIWLTADSYITGKNNLANMAYLGFNYYTGGITVLIFGVAMTEPRKMMLNEEKKSLRRFRVVAALMAAGVVVMVCSAMYLSFTPVGQTTIAGVQARYYLPLFLPAYFILYTDKFNCKFKQKNYDTFIWILVLLMWFSTIHISFLKHFCM